MRGYIEGGLEGSQAKELLSPCWATPPSQYVTVFTDLETLRIPYFGDFYGGFIM